MKYAIIDANNIVENVIVFELIDTVDVVESGKIVKSGFSMPGKLVVASDTAGIGDFYEPISGEFFTSEIAPVPRYIDKDAAIKALYDAIDNFISAITGRVPIDEKASWTMKEAAARAYQNSSSTPMQNHMLMAEAGTTKETLEELSARIIEKADKYLLIVACLAGIRRNAENLINEIVDPFEYETIIDAANQQMASLK